MRKKVNKNLDPTTVPPLKRVAVYSTLEYQLLFVLSGALAGLQGKRGFLGFRIPEDPKWTTCPFWQFTIERGPPTSLYEQKECGNAYTNYVYHAAEIVISPVYLIITKCSNDFLP